MATSSPQEWVGHLATAAVTSLAAGDRRKFHYAFPGGVELAEEYDAHKGNLVVRKWRRKTTMGGQGTWDFEVGEAMGASEEGSQLRTSITSPFCVRYDNHHTMEWRIRNLPYSLQTYSVSMDQEKLQIVVRTTNKKFFKRIDVPDLQRIGCGLEEGALSVAHANNTLLLVYKKPRALIDVETVLAQKRMASKSGKEGEADCKQS